MRYTSIDILRTAAIFLMVQTHFVENLSGLIQAVPSGFGATLFTFLSGVSYRLWLNGQQAKGKKDLEISKVTIRRGLFLFGTGFAFNILVWFPEDTFNWDILTFIGAALICLNFARQMPKVVLPVICVLVYLVSPALRALSDYPAYWTNKYFEGDLTLSDITLGFLVNGYFPIFPWILYPVAGFAVATELFPEAERRPHRLNQLHTLGLSLLGACLLAIYLRTFCPAIVQAVWLKGWSNYPASAEFGLGTMGFAILAFTLLHRWIDIPSKGTNGGAVAQVASTFSTHSFTVYLLHHVVHLWPLWLYGISQGDEPTEYWMKATSASVAWLLSILFLVVCYFLLRWMERNRIPGIETLMRWLCD